MMQSLIWLWKVPKISCKVVSSLWSLSTLRMSPTSGWYLTREPSDSSASITSHSPEPT